MRFWKGWKRRLVITKIIFWKIFFQLTWKYTFYGTTDNGIFPILCFRQWFDRSMESSWKSHQLLLKKAPHFHMDEIRIDVSYNRWLFYLIKVWFPNYKSYESVCMFVEGERKILHQEKSPFKIPGNLPNHHAIIKISLVLIAWKWQ